ncbi:M23 family metallopeptidase [Paractinoplanes toevensis]|uniref:M23ase beta-sheet core domain-containing protein n=1 Tax=Paractinoplanes toevensis TaxID=571911 RepID=A0A920BRD3_9ACTN|nr:M23 family metallopeptidase [Actinoplanes toevensis]GIM97516.1 hypothetical protein Ato02nite_093090 [Actinoplanes toevensis]
MALTFGVLAIPGRASAAYAARCPAAGSISQGYHSGHDGIDIANALGTPIYAVGAGTVTASGPAQGYGQWIRIKHADGSMTEYGHMYQRDVAVGVTVTAGQRIALMGQEGEATGPHLHLRTYATAGDASGINPADYLLARGVTVPCTPTSRNPQTVGYYNSGDATFHLSNTNASGSSTYAFGFGPANSAITPVVGDWDGNGKDSVGYYDARDATFHLSNDLASGSSDYAFGFGPANSAVRPVVGDWDGNGRDSVGYYDSRDATFHLSNNLASGSSNYAFSFGPATTAVRPVIGDWNGDGKDSIGYYDTRDATFHLSNNLASGSSNYAFGFGPVSTAVEPVVGDFDGNGTTTIGYHDTRDATFHLSNELASGNSDLAFGYGPTGTAIKGVFGDWNG